MRAAQRRSEAATGAHAGYTVYWNAENAHHVAAICEDPVEYAKRIDAFLKSALAAGDMGSQ